VCVCVCVCVCVLIHGISMMFDIMHRAVMHSLHANILDAACFVICTNKQMC